MKKPMELTQRQAQELKWFCRNILGLKPEFYKLFDDVVAFKCRIERLEKTCQLVEAFFGEQLKAAPHNVWEDDEVQNEKPD
jgi:hypothetical protein